MKAEKWPGKNNLGTHASSVLAIQNAHVHGCAPIVEVGHISWRLFLTQARWKRAYPGFPGFTQALPES